MSRRLRTIARWLAAQDYNRPRTDKTRAVLAIQGHAKFRAAVRQARRVRG